MFVFNSSVSRLSHNQDSIYTKLKLQNIFLTSLDISVGYKKCMDNFGGKSGKTVKSEKDLGG